MNAREIQTRNRNSHFRPARRATRGSRATSSGGSRSALASRRATILPTFSSTPRAGQVSGGRARSGTLPPPPYQALHGVLDILSGCFQGAPLPSGTSIWFPWYTRSPTWQELKHTVSATVDEGSPRLSFSGISTYKVSPNAVVKHNL